MAMGLAGQQICQSFWSHCTKQDEPTIPATAETRVLQLVTRLNVCIINTPNFSRFPFNLFRCEIWLLEGCSEDMTEDWLAGWLAAVHCNIILPVLPPPLSSSVNIRPCPAWYPGNLSFYHGKTAATQRGGSHGSTQYNYPCTPQFTWQAVTLMDRRHSVAL